MLGTRPKASPPMPSTVLRRSVEVQGRRSASSRPRKQAGGTASVIGRPCRIQPPRDRRGTRPPGCGRSSASTSDVSFSRKTTSARRASRGRRAASLAAVGAHPVFTAAMTDIGWPRWLRRLGLVEASADRPCPQPRAVSEVDAQARNRLALACRGAEEARPSRGAGRRANGTSRLTGAGRAHGRATLTSGSSVISRFHEPRVAGGRGLRHGLPSPTTGSAARPSSCATPDHGVGDLGPRASMKPALAGARPAPWPWLCRGSRLLRRAVPTPRATVQKTAEAALARTARTAE